MDASQPTQAYEDVPDYELHHLLLNGDPTAPARIVERYLDRLIERLSARFPNVPDLVEDAVSQALTAYVMTPHIYNPDLSPLFNFLYMAADRDLRNLWAAEKRRLKHEPVELDADDADVALNVSGAEYSVDETANPDRLDLDQDELKARIQQVLPDPRDQEMLALMVEGERRTAAFAQILGITSLPPAEQRAVVKRHKDRIKQRLRRAGIYKHGS
jgi:DNA-directed RNA polymerase specialized sigma24 family protein